MNLPDKAQTSVLRHFETEAKMQQWLQHYGHCFEQGLIVYLEGHLGAGKTSFSRGLLRALGYQQVVKSPTYTLLEIYSVAALSVCHFDLYRLADPEELWYLGVDDYMDGNSLWLVEWPDKGQGFLPAADLVVRLSALENGAAGRNMRIQAQTVTGEKVINCLNQR